MSPTVYLLSERFDYTKTIHADSGPGYARRHRWTTAPLSALRSLAGNGPVLVDNRITDEETAMISSRLPSLGGLPIYVKVVDPYWEWIRNPYYQWLLSIARFPNICFVGPYQATAFTALLARLAGEHAYLHLPYAYEEDRELPLDSVDRRELLAFTGATHPDFYPARAAMVRALRRRWWATRGVKQLRHPGYPDVGQTAVHDVTGDRFIRFLAHHRFMYLEPSRDGLEFLKYTECAYAGCTPAGRSPASFDPELQHLVMPLDAGSLVTDLRRLRSLSPEACLKNARDYREKLKAVRSVSVVEQRLQTHWQAQLQRLSAR